MGNYQALLITLAVIVVPIVLGSFLARRLRMPDYGWKLSVVLLTLAFGASVTWWGWQTNNIRKGIDLSGGVIMVYQVKGEKTLDTDEMNRLIANIVLRVNPGGVKEVTIRRAGADQIEVIVPALSADNDEEAQAEARRLEDLISRTGRLEFRILADRYNIEHKDLIDRALKDDAMEVFKPGNTGPNRKWDAKWVPVKSNKEDSFQGAGYSGLAKRVRTVNGREQLQILVVRGDYEVSGDYLTGARAGTDEHMSPCVHFNFDAEGASRFQSLTSTHLPQQGGQFTYKLGIVLDEYLNSAPSIQNTISDRGQITGRFTREEVDDLVNVLNAGALPAELSKEPISRMVIGPTLGRDTIERSSNAILIASILVPIFMVWYYRFSGLVANLALVINVLCILAIMIAIKAAFTLSGLAGLALTIGMAVDNNVLVYERLREERDHGATIRMGIRNAFARAAAVIIDSNVTTLIAAVVLYVIGTDQVRGFAVALFLGVSLSMFTSVWVARVIFDIAEKQRWLTELKMLRVIGETKIDFMKIFPITVTVSIVVILVGLVGTVVRGRGILDIDFTGGVSVQMVFKEGQTVDTEEVRRAVVEDAKLPDVVVTDIRGGKGGQSFLVNTSQDDLSVVQNDLKKEFGDKLVTNRVKIADVKPIVGEASKAEADEKKKDEAKKDEKVDPLVGGTQAKLTFDLGVNHEDLVNTFGQAAKAAGVDDQRLSQFSNAEYTTGDKRTYMTWTVHAKLSEADLQKVVAKMDETLAAQPYFPSSNKIGGAVAANTQQRAIAALVASWACMLVYLWIRFQGVAFGLAAVIALVHDILVMIAAIALSYWLAGPLGFTGVIDPFKINLTTIAAFLTIVGYSVNDTIIIFDRIREVRGKMPTITPEMVNHSVNQTLSRTLITSFTVLLVCVVLWVMGGEAIRGMAFALVVGVVSGTYSSIYIAAPILLWLSKPRDEKAKARAAQATLPAAR